MPQNPILASWLPTPLWCIHGQYEAPEAADQQRPRNKQGEGRCSPVSMLPLVEGYSSLWSPVAMSLVEVVVFYSSGLIPVLSNILLWSITPRWGGSSFPFEGRDGWSTSHCARPAIMQRHIYLFKCKCLVETFFKTFASRVQIRRTTMTSQPHQHLREGERETGGER